MPATAMGSSAELELAPSEERLGYERRRSHARNSGVCEPYNSSLIFQRRKVVYYQSCLVTIEGKENESLFSSAQTTKRRF